MSERIADRRKMMMDEAEGTVHTSQFSHPLPESDEDEDYIDTGAAILNFYCTLVDLLGRCAPDASVIALVSKVLWRSTSFNMFTACLNLLILCTVQNGAFRLYHK